MRALAGWVAVGMLLGCHTTRVQVIPALTPVDASRPFFVYAPIRGEACGEGAVEGALADLWRVAGDSHGFVTAVLEQEEGGARCVSITARPITYGCTPRPPAKLDVEPMHVVPGPASCAEASDACAPDCAKYATALGGGEFETRAFRERCLTRCRAADAPFLACARAAATADDVRKCDALP